MNDYYCIILEDKIYSQRTPNSKFIEFDLNGVKQRSFDTLPKEIQNIIDINNDIQKNPFKYFNYTITDNSVFIKQIYKTNIPYIKIPDFIENCPVRGIGSNVLECDEVEQIQLPDTLTKLTGYAFASYTKLKHINIPESVSTIPQHCFDGCTGITHIDLKNIKEIGTSAFSGCTSLKKIELDQINILYEYAFLNCKTLNTIIINSNLKFIPKFCFMNCHYLETLKLPETLEIIAHRAFANCGHLNEFIAPANLQHIGQFGFVNNNFTSIILNDTLQTVHNNAFNSISSIKTKVIINKNTEYYENSFSKQSIIREINKDKIKDEQCI